MNLSPEALDRLNRLAQKGDRAQSQSVDDFDWSQKHGVPFWLPNRLAGWVVSQFLHGERATAEMCALVAPRLNNATATSFLNTQYLDETRHAAIYERYLDKIGGLRPAPSYLCSEYQAARDWNGPVEGILLAYHVLLEGESLILQHDVARWLPCPLFHQIAMVIARDEARHVAFGKLWLGEALPKLDAAQHAMIHCWLKELWFDTVGDMISRLKPFEFVNGPKPWHQWLDENWAMREREMAHVGLIIDTKIPCEVAA